jgi:hypothetical protein
VNEIKGLGNTNSFSVNELTALTVGLHRRGARIFRKIRPKIFEDFCNFLGRKLASVTSACAKRRGEDEYFCK